MSLKVEIIRTEDNGTETTGKLYITGSEHYTCDTLERTYDGNKRGISSIPAGVYNCRKLGPTKNIPYDHIAIEPVSGRVGIRIHAGNLYTHSRGCVLVGLGWGDINKDGQKDVLNSKNTLKALLSYLPDTFTLKINEAIKSRRNKEVLL